MKSWNTDFDKRFNRMHRFVTWFIGGVLALVWRVAVAQDAQRRVEPVTPAQEIR